MAWRQAEPNRLIRTGLGGRFSHIDLLSKSDYAGKLSALGHVVDGLVLFIPVEGALAMARDP